MTTLPNQHAPERLQQATQITAADTVSVKTHLSARLEGATE